MNATTARSWFRRRFPKPYRIARSAYFRGRYAGRAVRCSVCGARSRGWIVPEGKPWHRVCPACESLPRQRLIWLWLERETDFFRAAARVLHIAPEEGLQRRFRSMPTLRYVSTDIASPLAEVHADLTAAPWEDGSFDVILCNHVLEHITDDRAAMSELYRLLAPGGWALTLVPFAPDRTTAEDPSVTKPEDRLRLFGQEDHVRLYGGDFIDRLADTGFDVEFGRYAATLGADASRYHGLQDDEFMIVIRKPAGVIRRGSATRRWEDAPRSPSPR